MDEPATLVQPALELLAAHGMPFGPGLSEAETAGLEVRFGFEFSPVHRAFLQAGVPAGPGWPDWRGDPDELRFRLDGPVDGLLFDIGHNGFWPAGWGPRPAAPDIRDELARERAARLPVLVPLYRHRFLPAAPAPEPTPVLSVQQSDVVHYGRDLLSYVRTEFGGRPRELVGVQPVPFWSELADG